MIAQMFIQAGHPIGLVLKYIGISKSTYYYRAKINGGKRGFPESKSTKTKCGRVVSNETVVKQIEGLLATEFVDYGYRKVTHWLRQNKNYIINEKKVYRLMGQHSLLNIPKPRFKIKREWVRDLLPQTTTSLEYLEVDIKYVFVHGAQRNALVVTVIDVESRWVLGQYMAWQIDKYDVIKMFDQIFNCYTLPSKIYVRNDNGSQFIAGQVQTYFGALNVTQEFIKPATPEQNAHIESYHSIVEKVICRAYQFEDLLETQDTFNRFIKFYNYDRIHSGIGYQSPFNYLTKKKIELPDSEMILKNPLNCRNNEIEIGKSYNQKEHTHWATP